MWAEILYRYPNFNSHNVEGSKLSDNFIAHFVMDVITLFDAGIQVNLY